MKNNRNLYWEALYAEMPIEKMHWYYPALDPDLEKALKEYNISSGTFLDLGTGPGTQAVELAKKGFTVIGTDISKNAVERASKLSDKVQFIQDDILSSKLSKRFDNIFDRGCFHTMNKDKRHKYIESVKQLLKINGLLFIKCFSDKQPEGLGPIRFSKKMIEQIFSSYFYIENIYDTEYQGTLRPIPRALFVIMRKSK